MQGVKGGVHGLMKKQKGPAVAVITAAGAKVNSMKSFMCTHSLAPFVPIHILL